MHLLIFAHIAQVITHAGGRVGHCQVSASGSGEMTGATLECITGGIHELRVLSLCSLMPLPLQMRYLSR